MALSSLMLASILGTILGRAMLARNPAWSACSIASQHIRSLTVCSSPTQACLAHRQEKARANVEEALQSSLVEASSGHCVTANADWRVLLPVGAAQRPGEETLPVQAAVRLPDQALWPHLLTVRSVPGPAAEAGEP